MQETFNEDLLSIRQSLMKSKDKRIPYPYKDHSLRKNSRLLTMHSFILSIGTQLTPSYLSQRNGLGGWALVLEVGGVGVWGSGGGGRGVWLSASRQNPKSTKEVGRPCMGGESTNDRGGCSKKSSPSTVLWWMTPVMPDTSFSLSGL